MTDEETKIVRMEQELSRLRLAEAQLRHQVLDMGHQNALLRAKCRACEYHPHPEQDRA